LRSQSLAFPNFGRAGSTFDNGAFYRTGGPRSIAFSARMEF
jgi:hypothetical protein